MERLSPMLYTEQIEETIRFYESFLGFECVSNNNEWGWAKLRFRKIEIMLSTPNEHLHFEKPSFTGSFYFYVDDVETLWDSLKDEVEIVYPLEKFDHGMEEFAIYDNNKYILQFGEEYD